MTLAASPSSLCRRWRATAVVLVQLEHDKTPGPRACVRATCVVASSWSSTVPGVVSGTSPLRMCRSDLQIVEVSIRTTMSVGSMIAGSATVPGAPAGTVVDESLHVDLQALGASIWLAVQRGGVSPVSVATGDEAVMRVPPRAPRCRGSRCRDLCCAWAPAIPHRSGCAVRGGTRGRRTRA